jgi:hypothetical protein
MTNPVETFVSSTITTVVVSKLARPTVGEFGRTTERTIASAQTPNEIDRSALFDSPRANTPSSGQRTKAQVDLDSFLRIEETSTYAEPEKIAAAKTIGTIPTPI